ncbi:protein NYNRIN-like [Perca flavescens]|uniref:protein NYNRIN-like n=1 Tax=Perca flavescens TaxID=8167 RepID=UPI00106EFDC3|nr:protein NYNRIN-like [Perca flavescens]
MTFLGQGKPCLLRGLRQLFPYQPLTKKQMMSFLGMCSYCRVFIPNYAELVQPLGDVIHGKGLTAHNLITWTVEAEQAFVDLKKAFQSPPTLGLPNPNLNFTQTVDECVGCMTSVFLQPHGDRLRPVAYFSAKLDPVAAGLPICLRAVAASERALAASRDIVGYAPLTLLVPHAVSLILLEQKASHLSAAQYLHYHTVLLDMPNVTVKRCTVLNPASLMSTSEEGEPHDCLAELLQTCTPLPDLSDTPFENPDLILYVDRTASRCPQTGQGQVGFAVVSDTETMIAKSLPNHLSAQAAELIALTEACKLADGSSVTIFTDSRYAFGVVHDFGALWKHRQFLKSDDNRFQQVCLNQLRDHCISSGQKLQEEELAVQQWEGPFQILLVTHTAVKVAERSTWVHATHCKQVPDPGEVPGSLTPATSDEQVPC